MEHRILPDGSKISAMGIGVGNYACAGVPPEEIERIFQTAFKNGLVSVTVVSSEGKQNDALSTALFVMGAERAAAYWRTHGGFEMLLVTEDGTILLTEGLESVFTLSEEQNVREVTVIHHEAE